MGNSPIRWFMNEVNKEISSYLKKEFEDEITAVQNRVKKIVDEIVARTSKPDVINYSTSTTDVLLPRELWEDTRESKYASKQVTYKMETFSQSSIELKEIARSLRWNTDQILHNATNLSYSWISNSQCQIEIDEKTHMHVRAATSTVNEIWSETKTVLQKRVRDALTEINDLCQKAEKKYSH